MTPAQIWAVDFEFGGPPGDPEVRCLVAHEIRSRKTLRLWRDEFPRRRAPYDCGDGSVVVAYYASAEMGCHLALGWPLPVNVIDLYAEFRAETNGLNPPHGNGLLGALAYYGEPAIDTAEKEEMRALALRGGVYSAPERRALLDYCESDVRGLVRLWNRMEPTLRSNPHRGHALLRGRYMKAAAAIERRGIPIDVPMVTALRARTAHIERELIKDVDRSFGVFDDGHFRQARFASYLKSHDIPWPTTTNGRLATDDDTFKAMARSYPELQPLHDLCRTLGQLGLGELVVRPDGRNSAMLSAFRSKTGRNQPSNSAFIFGFPSWMRGLIKPARGNALAYIDWSQQEIGIAAALSGDHAMMDAYSSTDPYLAFARQARAVDETATKATHGPVRDLFKACVLATQYGMGADALAQRIRQSPAHARALLNAHRTAYPAFWRWSEAVINYALVHRQLATSFGWRLQVASDPNTRSLGNFPIQATGADILRIACIYGFQDGIHIAAPVHDAVLIEAPDQEIDDAVVTMQQIMRQASEVALGGFPLRSEAKVIRWPGRFLEDRGRTMWERVQGLLNRGHPHSRRKRHDH